ncbi:MAG: hypothetical protein ABI554_06690 [Flavobacterium sp.]
MHTNVNDFITAFQNCCTKSKVASENRKTFEIISNEDFTRFRIDDCLITSKQIEKCDFGFIRHFNNNFYFVELKGKDIKKAMNQIISTLNNFETNFNKIPKEKVFGFIVSSRNPLSGTETNNLKQAFAKRYGKILEIKNLHYKHIPK